MASVDGLVSGLSTSTIISQLMQLEAQSQNRLKTRVSTEERVTSAYQTVNTMLKAALDKAKALDTSADWQLYKATSSAESVAASVTTGATAGTYTFEVTGLAAAHTVLYGTATADSTVVAGSAIDVTVGGTTTTLDVGGGTLAAVVAAINGDEDLGVRAGLVKVSDGSYRLMLNATSTGEAGQFTVSGLNTSVGSPTVTTTGADAAIQIGPDAVNDVIRSSSNTFADVFTGLSFTVSKEEAVTLTVDTDMAGLSNRVKGLVGSVSAAISEIAKQSAYNADTKTGGPLNGQLLPTQLRFALSGTVTDTTTGSLASVGIQLDRDGRLTMDGAKLTEVLEADPTKVEALVTEFAERVVAVAEAASKPGGSVTSAIEGRESRIKDLEDQIAAWDVRLELRRESLQRQYANLETTLGQLQSQGNWLAGQLAGLMGASS